ncbi:MAG TPA: CopG family antitoxin [Armatimonadota bacterium]|nr:CopG family antitoxin [Armatimonadota bacterium]
MRKDNTPISQAHSYQQIGEFWDTHDLADHWDQTQPAAFEVDLRSTATYYPLEQELSKKLRSIAERRGISSETLLNLWVQEKAGEEANRV